MQVSIEETSACQRTLHIEVPADTVAEEYSRVLNLFKSQASVPGFRAGKAPANLVKSRFHSKIMDEVRDQLVPKSYQDAISKEELQVVSVLNVSEPKVSDKEPLKFDVEVEVQPEFDLPKYKGIALKSESADVDEAKVAETISQILDQHARYEEMDGRAVQDGDLVQVDFEGTVDGQALSELDEKASGIGKAEDFWIRTDEKGFLPEIGEGIVGVEVGKSVDVTVTFAAEFPLEALQGKVAEYKVAVKGIKEKKFPEFDEAFCSTLGVADEAEFRTRVKEDLEKQAVDGEQNRLKDEVAQFLLEKTSIEVPSSLVESRTKQTINNIVMENSQRGVSREVMEEKKDEIYDTASATALSQVKLDFILTRIAKEEKLEISAEEVEQRINELAAMYSRPVAELKKQLSEQNRLQDIQMGMLVEKTSDFILENAKIS